MRPPNHESHKIKMMLPTGLTERIAALLGPLGYLDQPEEWDDPYRFFRW